MKYVLKYFYYGITSKNEHKEYIQAGRKVLLHQKNFTGRGGCREQCELGYPCPEMNSNAATGTFLRKLGNAATQAIRRDSYYVCFGSDGSLHCRLYLVAEWVSTRLAK